MTDNLFSHAADAEHVVTKTDDSADPVAHPVFSDKSR